MLFDDPGRLRQVARDYNTKNNINFLRHTAIIARLGQTVRNAIVSFPP